MFEIIINLGNAEKEFLAKTPENSIIYKTEKNQVSINLSKYKEHLLSFS
jgi:hypothetical protein